MTLPNPMGRVMTREVKVPFESSVAAEPGKLVSDDPTGMVAATIGSGLAQHLEVAPPSEHAAIRARVTAMQTHAEALAYLKEVHLLVNAARQRAGVQRSAMVRMHA